MNLPRKQGVLLRNVTDTHQLGASWIQGTCITDSSRLAPSCDLARTRGGGVRGLATPEGAGFLIGIHAQRLQIRIRCYNLLLGRLLQIVVGSKVGSENCNICQLFCPSSNFFDFLNNFKIKISPRKNIIFHPGFFSWQDMVLYVRLRTFLA